MLYLSSMAPCVDHIFVHSEQEFKQMTSNWGPLFIFLVFPNPGCQDCGRLGDCRVPQIEPYTFHPQSFVSVTAPIATTRLALEDTTKVLQDDIQYSEETLEETNKLLETMQEPPLETQVRKLLPGRGRRERLLGP